MFSTKLHDNDIYPANCATNADGSPWWYAKCHTALLTGIYGKDKEWKKGILWNIPWGITKLAKYATMMARSN